MRKSNNVHGWERAASLAGGIALLGRGIRKGGVLGLLEVAMGSASLMRGLSGHCAAKQWLEDSHARFDVSGSDLQDLRDVAGRATRGTTVAGE